MKSQSPSECLSSFDPAIHLHSEAPEVASAHPVYSDDIEALNITAQELRAKNQKAGVVIQHRAWQIPEIFRSEGTCSIGS